MILTGARCGRTVLGTPSRRSPSTWPSPRLFAPLPSPPSLLAAAGSAEAGPPGKWTQVTGVGADDANPMRPGLARTPDGVLHVSWTRDVGGGGSVLHSAISADAKTISGRVSIYDNVAGGVNFGSDLAAAPDGTLRAFFTATNVFDNVLATATSANGGASWAVGGPASKSGPAGKDVYTADGISATIGKDGTFYSVWGDSSPDGGGYHVGLDPNPARRRSPRRPSGRDEGRGGLGQRTGGLGLGLAHHRRRRAAAARSRGRAVAAPQLCGLRRDHRPHRRTGCVRGRLLGSNPFLADPSVYRVDTGQATRLTKKDGELTALAAAPGGRLWAFWKVDGNSIRATRSNAAATKWGQIVSVQAPKGDQRDLQPRGRGFERPARPARARGQVGRHPRFLAPAHPARTRLHREEEQEGQARGQGQRRREDRRRGEGQVQGEGQGQQGLEDHELLPARWPSPWSPASRWRSPSWTR